MAITPEPRITPRGEMRWRVRYRIDGTQTSKSFTTEQGALEFADLIDRFGPEKAVGILEARIGAPETLTVLQLCENHLDNLTGVQPDTIRGYRGMLKDLGPLAELPANAVTETDIGEWVEALVAAGASGKTAANKHGFLASVFKRAHSKGQVPTNPCTDTRIPRTVARKMVVLTREELDLLLTYIPEFWRLFVKFLFFTGLRFGEATALRIMDLDLPNGSLSVAQSWKKGRVLGAPKSRRSLRTVRMPDHLVKELTELAEGRGAQEFVFVNQRGAAIRQNTFHKNVWAPAVRLINGEPANRPGAPNERSGERRDESGQAVKPSKTPLGKRPRIHDARHTCASWLLSAGVSIYVVQDHLGHESIKTTVDTYGHLLPGARDAVADALG